MARTVRRTPSRARRLIANLGLALASVLLCLSAVEIAFRVFWPQILVPQIFEPGPGGITIKLRPNVRGNYHYPEYSHAIETNSRGLRGRNEYPFAKPNGLRRILVLGDSFTMGQGVEFEEAFPAVLQDRLRRAGAESVEVINAGTPGWSTSEELIYFQEEARKYKPDVIVLAFCDNDVSTNLNLDLFACEGDHLIRRRRLAHDPVSSGRRWTELIPGYSHLVQRSHLANFVRVTLVRAIWQANPSVVQDGESRRKAWELTLALMRKLVREARSSGAEVVLLYVPEKPLHREHAANAGSHYRRREYHLLANDQVLAAACGELGIRFVNLLPVLKAAGESACYYAQDTHWRARGHELAAKELEVAIRSL